MATATTGASAATEPTAQTNLEQRVSELEAKMVSVLAEKTPVTVGGTLVEAPLRAFKDSPDYDAAMGRGEEYRRAQPSAADDSEAVPA